MRSISKVLSLLFTLLVSSNTIGQNVIDIVELPFEKDLFPEGIAISHTSKRIFLNSLKHNKIVSVDLNGKNATLTLPSHEHGYLSGFGMTIKGDTLYALGNSLPKINNTSILLLLEISSGKLIKSYSLDNPDFIYLNDIAISSNDNVYITDSESNNIYTINESIDQLEVFYSNDEIRHPNGIAISPDNEFLYLATYTSGIRILNIKTKSLINHSNNHKGIDGMKFYNNSLIAIVNSRRESEKNGIYQFSLNENQNEIRTEKRIHRFGQENDIPTTFAIYNDFLFFVEDSQMDNFNQNTNEIIDNTKLEPYRLVKLRLSDL